METDQIPNIAVVVDLIAIVVAAFFLGSFAWPKMTYHMHDYGVTIEEEMTITSKKK